MLKKIINFAGYLITWIASAYGAKNGHVWLGLVSALVFLTIHLKWCASVKHELLLIIFVTGMGCTIDSALYYHGYFNFIDPNPFHPLSPPWMWAAWLAFSTTLNSSLAILQKHRFIAASIGAVDLPLSYLIAAHIGVLHFIKLWNGLFILSMLWLFLLPLATWIAAMRGNVTILGDIIEPAAELPEAEMVETMVKKAELPQEEIIQVICNKIAGVKAVYIFGSAMTEFATDESDVDLAVLGEQKLDATLVWQVAQDIASLLKKDVDLIDLWQASTVMRWQIITTGKRIFVKDEKVSDAFENTSLCAYVRFNEERQEIIEEIQKRGKVL